MKTATTIPAFEFDSALLKDKSLEGINPFDIGLTEEVKKRIYAECEINTVYYTAICAIVSDTMPRKLFSNVRVGSGRDVSYVLDRLGGGGHGVTKSWQEAFTKGQP